MLDPEAHCAWACVLGSYNKSPVAQTAPQQEKEKDTAMGE